MFTKYLVIVLTLFASANAYSTSFVMCNNKRDAKVMSRRVFTVLSTSLISSPVFSQDVENKPLTPEEMEEYNKLLEEAKRIQNIIDLNIKAADEELREIEEKTHK